MQGGVARNRGDVLGDLHSRWNTSAAISAYAVKDERRRALDPLERGD